MRFSIVGAILLTGCAHDLRSDDEKLMGVIEQSVALPKGASPLQKYRRYYAWSPGDSQVIEAVYSLGGRADRLWLTADELPIVLDGGCSVVTFKFDVPTQRAMNVRCNGN